MIAITNHSICMKCQEREYTHIYNIPNRGYGSIIADGYGTHFQLCDDCHEDKFDLWVGEQPEMIDEYCEDYKYEQNILDFINELSLESQELFFNSFDREGAYEMDAQDWIDYKLNILPHEKCKEYGLYSYEEKQAYKERFPTCGQVYLQVYEDESSSCKCNNGAYGNKDGTCNHIWTGCYLCSAYSPKESVMRTEYETENERQRLLETIRYAQERLAELG